MEAKRICVQGTVQGVGFRPFVYRLAHEHTIMGWVLNGDSGVEIHAEGEPDKLQSFLYQLEHAPPPAAVIASLSVNSIPLQKFETFSIKRSQHKAQPTVRVSPDLAVCEACQKELVDQNDLRFGYPYTNCTNCGPRYSIILGLPYDRPLTTMKEWRLCATCLSEYSNPLDRRFHAQPVACPNCGPKYYLKSKDSFIRNEALAIQETVKLLKEGKILALKGLGGYHLACNARNPKAVKELRQRKFRKEKPFALMASTIEVAQTIANISSDSQELLESTARPIVLLTSKVTLEAVSPDNHDLGIMLPYTPLHHLLFNAGAPDCLVMTSANRSSEPIAYKDAEALESLDAIADAFLIGERPIARRVDDSITRVNPFGSSILRRARGYAPASVSNLPARRPILALGADLKSSITLVVKGQAFVSQHLGDLDHYEALKAFKETLHDLVNMYEVDLSKTTVVHDKHPYYYSSQYALDLPAKKQLSVQHHRAHVASVLAERGSFDKRVLGLAFDGTGYGDDKAIWGGEFFVGSLQEGFERVAHLRYAKLVGGDAAAKYPIQAAAGFLNDLEPQNNFNQAPFAFPKRYQKAAKLAHKDIQTFQTTSMGRLFDAVAALLGYTKTNSFEGQAAIWLEHLARSSSSSTYYPFPFENNELDYRPLLQCLSNERKAGKDTSELARAFHNSLSRSIREACIQLTKQHQLDTVVLSGGVFQNNLLLELVKADLKQSNMNIWVNHTVPANDGGISLGQAALACFI